MKNKIDMRGANRLRESALHLGRALIWHADNSPLATWKAADDAGCKLDCWPGNLFHALHNARPKRKPTAQEVAAIAKRLEGMFGYVPLHRLAEIATDPDWALFSLPPVDVI